VTRWAGKYVIGLTGNICTGKSVVRRMLEHLGAYGIDADALAHRVIAQDAPGYRKVVQTFGRYILTPDGEIDRQKLGRLVFGDPEALAQLEQIVHPYVEQLVDLIIERASQPVIVIEAIKLLEANIGSSCDSIWVTYAPPEVQMQRLITRRKMNAEEARRRIEGQPPQEEKIAAAQVMINNDSSFENIWKQVVNAWKNYVPVSADLVTEAREARKSAKLSGLHVEKGRPRDAREIAQFINRNEDGHPKFTSQDIMEAFGEKAFLLLFANHKLVGILGWQVENLIARTIDLIFEPQVSLENAVPLLIENMERSSKELQCEASLIFVPNRLERYDSVWKKMGYQLRTIQSLGVSAWKDAAKDSMPDGTTMFFKQLREDRVLKPI
jgi:dephospho-CoA kinase